VLERLVHWVFEELQRPLVLFGFAAQFVFFLRFVVQWFESERRGRSHIPIAFWYLSILGGVMILVYSVLEGNLVFTCASLLSLVIYVRNLMLIFKRRARVRDRHERARPIPKEPPSPPGPVARATSSD
jgi:lipid-A-disaccharide synthase-like uncharacterized protein